MEQMKKIHTTLILILAVLNATAQQPPMVIIHGHVIYQETGLPVKGQSVLISIDSSQNFGHYKKVVTDANGEYTDFVPYMYDHNQAIDVYTNDFLILCSHALTSVSVSSRLIATNDTFSSFQSAIQKGNSNFDKLYLLNEKFVSSTV